MPREILSRRTEPLFDKDGKHVADRTDTWYVDRRDGIRHQAQPSPKPKPQTPAPRPTPPPLAAQAPRLLTLRHAKQAVLEAMTAGVPAPPPRCSAGMAESALGGLSAVTVGEPPMSRGTPHVAQARVGGGCGICGHRKQHISRGDGSSDT